MIQIDIDMPKSCMDCPCAEVQDGWCCVHNEVLERMENGFPSRETKPEWCPIHEPKHGKWINITENNAGDCSECGYHGRAWMNYCPICGADMRKCHE